MKYGTINCKCGQQFYFESASNQINCIQCDLTHDISNYPEKSEIVEVEFTEELVDSVDEVTSYPVKDSPPVIEGEPDGTDI